MLGSYYECTVPLTDAGCRHYRDGVVACSHFIRDPFMSVDTPDDPPMREFTEGCRAAYEATGRPWRGDVL